MRDPKRIDKFLEMVGKYWHKVPDWRFGQLISNVFCAESNGRDIFFPEEDEVQGWFEDFFKDFGIEVPPYEEKCRNYFCYRMEAGEWMYRSYYEVECEHMMRDICEYICFNDCYPIEFSEIVYKGRRISYKGWQPGMVFEFCYEGTDDVAWSNSYPEWDH